LEQDITDDPQLDYLGDLEHGKIYTYSVNSYKGCYDLYPELEGIDFIEVQNT